jgi:prepilin-type N-terminal cleavage/methylation domain-containing protein
MERARGARKVAGVTLIELMAVVIIVAILAAAAVPLVLGQTRRAQVADAVSGLGTIRTTEQVYYAEHNVYLAVAAPNVGSDPSDAPPGLGLDFTNNTYFNEDAFSVVLDATEGFIATADGGASTAPRADDVADYRVQMKGDGQIRYDWGDGWTGWE